MSIPVSIDPLGTLGASPLPSGWHEVEKVLLPYSFFEARLFTAPEENIPAWDDTLDMLFDIETVKEEGSYFEKPIGVFVGTTEELSIGLGGGQGANAVIYGEKTLLARWPIPQPWRIKMSVKNGIVSVSVDGEEKASALLKERTGGVESGFFVLNKLWPKVNLLRSHYFSHDLNYEFVPCQNGNGDSAVFETRTKTLINFE